MTGHKYIISLIMPFRERIKLFNEMMKSLKETVRFPNLVELIIAIDDDDKVLYEYGLKRIIDENKEISIKFYQTKRSEHFIRDYWNPIAKMAQGRWIMAINDDTVFKTRKWDLTIDQKMSARAKDFGDDIIYGKVDDCCHIGGRDPKNAPFSCWCLQGWETQKALGYFYDPNIWVWGPDQVCGLVFLWLNDTLHEDRIVNIYDVVIDHNSFHTEKREKDKFFYEQEKIDKAHWFETTREHELKQSQIITDYVIEKRKHR